MRASVPVKVPKADHSVSLHYFAEQSMEAAIAFAQFIFLVSGGVAFCVYVIRSIHNSK